MNHTERRNRLRKILAGNQCHLTRQRLRRAFGARRRKRGLRARHARGLGRVEHDARRARSDRADDDRVRGPDPAHPARFHVDLLVDADHGYGNALNVMRTVEECEHSGVSAMSIEDTVLPTRFGHEGGEELISMEEGVGKMKAALAARRDPSLIIAGRTSALKVEGLEGTIGRAKAYAAAGVDAIFLVGVETIDQVKAVHDAVKLPIIVGSAPASLKREDFAAAGARMLLQGHQPVAAAVKALREVYEHLHKGGAPADLKSKIASNEEMNALTRNDDYTRMAARLPALGNPERVMA